MARLSDMAGEANMKAQKSVTKTEAGRMIKSAMMDMSGGGSTRNPTPETRNLNPEP